MAFKVGDRVRILPDAIRGYLCDSEGDIFPVTKVDFEGRNRFPYTLYDAVTDRSEGFSDEEIELADQPQPETPPALAHDYMLGYADGYNFPGGAEVVEYHDNADYRAGFVAGWERFSADCNQEMRHNLFGD